MSQTQYALPSSLTATLTHGNTEPSSLSSILESGDYDPRNFKLNQTGNFVVFLSICIHCDAPAYTLKLVLIISTSNKVASIYKTNFSNNANGRCDVCCINSEAYRDPVEAGSIKITIAVKLLKKR